MEEVERSAALDEPVLMKRHCGGWLAIAPKDEPIKIGVTSATEEGAIQKYRETIAECRKTLQMGGVKRAEEQP